METQNLELKSINTAAPVSNPSENQTVPGQATTALEIQSWLVSYLGELLEIGEDEIDVKTPFDRYGLDSAAVVGMTGDLQNLIGQKIPPDVAYKFPTIEALAQHLATR